MNSWLIRIIAFILVLTMSFSFAACKYNGGNDSIFLPNDTQVDNTVKVNTEIIVGEIKPMHAVNNGPARQCGQDNFDTYKYAGIPYARTHDSSFYSGYGGYNTVDVHAIFSDFDADVNDPNSYDFTLTDKYLSEIQSVGTEVFYRLGTKIENEAKKYNIYPPKDFQKWAEICEHIIRHYTEGWASGYYYDITYWEIWNEPDNLHCWAGTQEQFFDFYTTTATHLKECFPHLKIGGPAVTGGNTDFNDAFLKHVKEHNAPLDFFSYHCYSAKPETVETLINTINSSLIKYNLDCETILNEWNYVKEWSGEGYTYSMKLHTTAKCAAFVSSVMAVGQKNNLDMLMYYDARPLTTWNGMWDAFMEAQKPYYSFYFFNKLYVMGSETETQVQGNVNNIYAIAAKGENGKKGLLITTYNDDDGVTEKVAFKAEISGLSGNSKVSFYLLDENHDGTLMATENVTDEVYSPVLNVDKNSIIFIEIESI